MSRVAKKKRISREMSAAEFKAKCLELMDLVNEQGTEIVITKRGRPVAKLAPIEAPPKQLFGALHGLLTISGDIVSPTGEEWEAET